MNMDAGQAGECWFRFHGIILTEWLLEMASIRCKEVRSAAENFKYICNFANIYVDINY